MVHLIINIIVATTFFFLVFIVKKDYKDLDLIFGGLLLIQPISIIIFKYHIISLASGYLIKISAFDIITYLLYVLFFIYFVGSPIEFYNFDQVDNVEVGAKVSLKSVDADQTYQGVIKRINAQVNTQTQSVAVYIQVKNPKLKEGMFLEAQIEAKEFDNVFAINRGLILIKKLLMY